MLSAPHYVSQTRENIIKPKDLGSGELVYKLALENNLSYIIKCKNNGDNSTNDDANYYADCDYRKKIFEICNNKNVYLFDIHSMKPSRNFDINIAVNNGVNISNNYELLEKIIKIFENYDFSVSIDKPFTAGNRTICYDIHEKCNNNCFMIEFNSNLINPKFNENKIEIISKAMNEIIEIINLYY